MKQLIDYLNAELAALEGERDEFSAGYYGAITNVSDHLHGAQVYLETSEAS